MSFGEVLLNFSLEGGPIADIDHYLDNDHIVVAQYSREEAVPTLAVINIHSGEIVKIVEKAYNGVNTILKVICNRELNKLIYTAHIVGEFHIISYDLETDQKHIIKKLDRPEEAVSYTLNSISPG